MSLRSGKVNGWNPLAWAAVFVPHWLIDRFSLALVWLRLIGSRTFEEAQVRGGASVRKSHPELRLERWNRVGEVQEEVGNLWKYL